MDPVAQALARARGRVVVVFLHRPRCILSRQFETEILADADVRAWLESEAAFVSVDAEREPDLIDRYAVQELPGALVFGRGGAELARLDAFEDPRAALRILKSAAEGKDILADAFEAASHDDPFELTRLAELLAERGRRDEALDTLRRAVDSRKNVACPNCVGLYFFAEAVARLGWVHPPALDYLRSLRERAEERLLLGVGANDDDADDFVSLCCALRDRRRIHEVYEGAEGGPARRLLGKHAEHIRLTELRHVGYRWGDPSDVPALERQIARHLLPGAPSVGRFDTFAERARLRAAAGRLLERLFTAGREPEARAVCELVIGMDASGSVWTNLIRLAEQGGAAALAAELKARAALDIPRLPLRERADVRKALAPPEG
ncbi:hypothetical protein EPO15_12355 [bacterium]|nr:MAG: hypothetical protein EPO15_12355 [bacterium]